MIIHEKRLSIKEQCKIMAHIERKARKVAGLSIADKVYADIFQMAMREAGAYGLDYVDPRYLSAIHKAIDNYKLPSYLADEMEEGETDDGENNSSDGDSELG